MAKKKILVVDDEVSIVVVENSRLIVDTRNVLKDVKQRKNIMKI